MWIIDLFMWVSLVFRIFASWKSPQFQNHFWKDSCLKRFVWFQKSWYANYFIAFKNILLMYFIYFLTMLGYIFFIVFIYDLYNILIVTRKFKFFKFMVCFLSNVKLVKMKLLIAILCVFRVFSFLVLSNLLHFKKWISCMLFEFDKFVYCYKRMY